MPEPSKIRSRIYASIAGIGLAAVSYWLGTIHGATAALDQFRDLSFMATDAALRRAIRFDALLDARDIDGARRGTMGAAASHYESLEVDAAGSDMPATPKMKAMIVDTRRAIADYCATSAAVFHESAAINLCAAQSRTKNDPAVR
jgi:hypothetical protein